MTIRKLLLLSATLLASFLAHAAPERVQAELIGSPSPDGRGHILGLRLTPEAGWHTYWQNSGDAGLPTKLRWNGPEGVDFGPTEWPTPHAYAEGPLMTYGYGEAHTLVSRVAIPNHLGDEETIELKARWLVCKDVCIPESRELSISIGQIRGDGFSAQVALALQALPEVIDTRGQFALAGTNLQAYFPLPAAWFEDADELLWFPQDNKLIQHAAPVTWTRGAQGLVVTNPLQNGATPGETIDGVLVIHGPHGARSLQVSLTPGTIPTDLGAQPAEAEALSLWMALAMAFVGGLILNLMPCVFPVLTLKALSLTRSHDDHARRIESLAYAAGVLLSFLSFAGTLLALRAGGAALGWGFQLQNPVIVGALAVLMIIMGLAMLGWTQIGMGMMGAGQNLTQDGGLKGAFFTGVLAVVVASPCSAPFMGGALGFAVLQPAPIALSIFASLGVGLAAPFVLIAWVPALARRLPRPGPWMEKLKHIMAIPLFATGAWLAWVMWRQAGNLPLLFIIGSAVLIALGIHQTPGGRSLPKPAARALQLTGLGLLLAPMWFAPQQRTEANDDWQAWSPTRVAEARTEGRMILVDFTADWCLSCIVNERAALKTDEVQSALAAENALMLKADWSQYDPTITAALAEFGRNGVPLYLVYPQDGGEPEVLPQILTPGIVLAAIERASR